MGFFDKLKSLSKFYLAKNSSPLEFEDVIERTLDAGLANPNINIWNISVKGNPVYVNEVLLWEDSMKADFIAYFLKKGISTDDERERNGDSSWNSSRHFIVASYINELLQTKLLLNDADIIKILMSFMREDRKMWYYLYEKPISYFLKLVTSSHSSGNLSEECSIALHVFTKYLQSFDDHAKGKKRLKLIDSIEKLVYKGIHADASVRPAYFLGDDEFAAYANPDIEQMAAEERDTWYKLITKAQEAAGSKPTSKFLKETQSLILEAGESSFHKMMIKWWEFLIQTKDNSFVEHTIERGRYVGKKNSQFISPVSLEAIKGFIWMCAYFHDPHMLSTIARLAERSFRKIPEKGPAAVSVGNACLYTLFKSEGMEGIGHLSRLNARIKQPSAHRMIEKYLLAAANDKGVSMSEIEDLVVDDFGLVHGQRTFLCGDYSCQLRITGIGKSELTWNKPNGSPQKSVPLVVKENYPDKLKEIKSLQKQMDQAVSAQRDRIDRMLRVERKMTMQHFQTRYLEHGLMSYLAKKLIWVFNNGENSQPAFYHECKWIHPTGVVIPDPGDLVSLWHPVTRTVEEITAWRAFLVDREIQQPVKQAFREVYILTDAEVNTRVYSNRMAAHILRQHQYVSLAKGRHWTARLLGAWDGGGDDIAELKIPEHNIKAQFWIQSVDLENGYSPSGIWNFVSTDQVRFSKMDTNEVIDLIHVPAVLFSEVMRDVDLFVGVASVGNDPSWQDSGGDRRFNDYWVSYSFGDLSEMAKNRKDILTRLVPRLKINKVAEVRDKFLVVKGKVRTYKIHIGSTNIMMEPNDQYLCIVPDRTEKDYTRDLFLPFEGDTGLSIILSKAFLLADDDKLSDGTILSQIRNK